MKVAFLLRSAPVGGVEYISLRLAGYLRDCGFEVLFFFICAEGDLVGAFADEFRVVSLGGPSDYRRVSSVLSLWSVGRKLAAALREEKVDLLISAKEQANLMGLLVRCCGGKFKLWCVRHVPLSANELNVDTGLLTRMLYRTALWRADRLIGVSEGIAKQIEELVPSQKRGRVCALPNPVYDETLIEAASQPLPRKWATGRVIVAVGRLHRQKGFDYLIEAFSTIAKGVDSLTLVIVGDGPERAALVRLASARGVASSVEFWGHQPNPICIMKRADVFVLPSRYEGLPTTLIEALALHGRVVAYDCETGPAEIVSHFGYGVLVQVGDVEGLAAAINEMLNSPCKVLVNPLLADYFVGNAGAKYRDEIVREIAGPA